MSFAQGAEVARNPKGTPLDEVAGSLSIPRPLPVPFSAPLPVVRPLDKRTGGVQPWAAFEWAEPAREVLAWDARRPRLLAELRAARADVLCLQEVQFERTGAGGAARFVLPPWLCQLAEEEGYTPRLPSEGPLQQMAERNLRVLDAEVAIGCVVMYRHDRLEEVDEASASRFANTLVGACLRGRGPGGLGSLGPTAVFSVHLDATSEEKRVEQMKRCLAHARQMGTREVVVAGDFNTECLPGSCIGAMDVDCGDPTDEDHLRECASALRIGGGEPTEGADAPEECTAAAAAQTTDGPTEQQLKDFAALRDRAVSLCREYRVAFSHVVTGPTRAAYDHGKTCGPCVSWRLDHIYYTARTLRLRSSWQALEGDPASAARGLPNESCPSRPPAGRGRLRAEPRAEARRGGAPVTAGAAGAPGGLPRRGVRGTRGGARRARRAGRGGGRGGPGC
ncbi:unnamed protein product [Prorocentrum cordatum]|uniref:Endonuclease/exonuclease/phosphatase domain-containing protein n=1 Tax=Prorocentrum cordatum TaxID=2364126 RepID=A0ABN9X4Z6_9DINO|nr:unnamed protein product [Polarella glacialis]